MAGEKSRAETGRILLQALESLERAGVTHLPKSRRPPATVAAKRPTTPQAAVQASARGPSIDKGRGAAPKVSPAASPPGLAPVEAGPQDAYEGKPVPLIQRPAALDVIRREVAGCSLCAELARTRTQTVFGVGDPGARLVFMGEAPGADEDQQGEPFVGKAGQLLNKIIEACTLRRQDVYILNSLKCRPPGNRTPQPDELAHCEGFLQRQLAILRPEFICCLGAVASHALLQTDTPIGRLRKRFHAYRGSRVVCTYHPAYLLRNPAAKKDVWEDMQMLCKEMGIALPAK